MSVIPQTKTISTKPPLSEERKKDVQEKLRGRLHLSKLHEKLPAFAGFEPVSLHCSPASATLEFTKSRIASSLKKSDEQDWRALENPLQTIMEHLASNINTGENNWKVKEVKVEAERMWEKDSEGCVAVLNYTFKLVDHNNDTIYGYDIKGITDQLSGYIIISTSQKTDHAARAAYSFMNNLGYQNVHVSIKEQKVGKPRTERIADLEKNKQELGKEIEELKEQLSAAQKENKALEREKKQLENWRDQLSDSNRMMRIEIDWLKNQLKEVTDGIFYAIKARFGTRTNKMQEVLDKYNRNKSENEEKLKSPDL